VSERLSSLGQVASSPPQADEMMKMMEDRMMAIERSVSKEGDDLPMAI
jgi:hypothetical protein